MPPSDEEKAKQREHNKKLGVLRMEVARLKAERDKLRAEKLGGLDNLAARLSKSSAQIINQNAGHVEAHDKAAAASAAARRPNINTLFPGGVITKPKRAKVTYTQPVIAKSALQQAIEEKKDQPKAMSFKKQSDEEKAQVIDALKKEAVHLMAEISILNEAAFTEGNAKLIADLEHKEQELNEAQENVSAVNKEKKKLTPPSAVPRMPMSAVDLQAAVKNKSEEIKAKSKEVDTQQALATAYHGVNAAANHLPAPVDGYGLLKSLVKQSQLYFPEQAGNLAQLINDIKLVELGIHKGFIMSVDDLISSYQNKEISASDMLTEANDLLEDYKDSLKVVEISFKSVEAQKLELIKAEQLEHTRVELASLGITLEVDKKELDEVRKSYNDLSKQAQGTAKQAASAIGLLAEVKEIKIEELKEKNPELLDKESLRAFRHIVDGSLELLDVLLKTHTTNKHLSDFKEQLIPYSSKNANETKKITVADLKNVNRILDDFELKFPKEKYSQKKASYRETLRSLMQAIKELIVTCTKKIKSRMGYRGN